jgi:hypothetical protein
MRERLIANIILEANIPKLAVVEAYPILIDISFKPAAHSDIDSLMKPRRSCRLSPGLLMYVLKMFISVTVRLSPGFFLLKELFTCGTIQGSFIKGTVDFDATRALSSGYGN